MDANLLNRDPYLALHYAENKEQYLNAMSPPVFLTSLHKLDTIEDYYNPPKGSFLYGRYGNPTVDIAEKKIAALERGKRAFLYASGMAAATAAVMAVCRSGSHIVCVHNAYGPLLNFLGDYTAPDLDITVTVVHGYSMEEIEQAIQENTAMIILESPGSVTFSLVDLEAVAKLVNA